MSKFVTWEHGAQSAMTLGTTSMPVSSADSWVSKEVITHNNYFYWHQGLFSTAFIVAASKAEYFGSGTGRIVLDDVQCTGSETHLTNCTSTVINHNCDHTEDVGVKCGLSVNCAHGDVRLQGGGNEGKLEVCIGGVWGTVCPNTWGIQEAIVSCNQLELPSTGASCILNPWPNF